MTVNYANRGKFLETIIDNANDYYRKLDIADIRKVPTPFKVLGAYRKTLKYGHHEAGDWVDYVGIYQGRLIAFDAKQTKGKSLPLANIHEHQYRLLESFHLKYATCFLIVYFSDIDKYYLLRFETLREAFKLMIEGGRKSIPLKVFEDEAQELEFHGQLDYIKYL